MSHVIATHNEGIDLLPSLLARLKQHMLEHYAAAMGLEAERHWTRHSDDVVVACDEFQVGQLLGTLHNKGCTDLHVYSTDACTLSLVRSGVYGGFRVVEMAWRAEPVAEPVAPMPPEST